MAGEKTLNGSNYIMEIDVTTPITEEHGLAYRPIVCEVTSTFSIDTDSQAVSNACSGFWRTDIPNSSGFAFTGEWQAINPRTGEPDAISANLIAKLAAGQTKFWARRKLKDGMTGAEIYREGRVWISRYEDTASIDEPFTFSADFMGHGQPILDPGYDYVGVLYETTGEKPITKGDNLIITKA